MPGRGFVRQQHGQDIRLCSRTVTHALRDLLPGDAGDAGLRRVGAVPNPDPDLPRAARPENPPKLLWFGKNGSHERVSDMR